MAPSGSHSMVELTQVWSWPQVEVAQESPGAGGVAHVPQIAYLVPEQYPLVHWALKAQDTPFAAGPVGAQAAGGLPLKKSAHEYVANAVAHSSTIATVFPVLGAARPFMQASASRVSHAASVPKERTMLAPVASMAFEQLIRFAH